MSPTPSGRPTRAAVPSRPLATDVPALRRERAKAGARFRGPGFLVWDEDVRHAEAWARLLARAVQRAPADGEADAQPGVPFADRRSST